MIPAVLLSLEGWQWVKLQSVVFDLLLLCLYERYIVYFAMLDLFERSEFLVATCKKYIVPYCRSVRHVPTLKIRVVLFLVCIKNSTISSKNDHCCILVQVACSFFVGWDLALFFFLYCTYVPRVCRVIPCPILLVRASYHTVFSCDNNSVFITPQINISCFGGMYKKKQHHQQAWSLLYTRTF